MATGKGQYLSRDVLDGFDKYKYSAVDTSIISKYITHPFWNWIVQFVPKWVAPNTLTLLGFLHLVMSFVLLSFYDPDYYAASPDHPERQNVPNWVWLLCSYYIFMSHTLDGIDGKQARRTGSSSPLGEMFDHGLDSWATVFFPAALYSIFGRGEFGVEVFRVYLVLIMVMFCFLLSHWEKYNTGTLFLPWGYDISQIIMVVVFFVTSFGGHQIWHFKIPFLNILCAEGIELSLHFGVFGLTVPPTLWNIYVSYRDKTGKMRGPWEALRPLVSAALLFILMTVWIKLSSYQILEKQPRLMFWTTGAIFSNITCRLIIAQMSNTRCELINWLLYLLVGVVAFSLIVRPGQLELYLLWCLCLIATVSHLHFGVGVVSEMCDHFKIMAFTIKNQD